MSTIPKNKVGWEKVRIIKTSDHGPVEDHTYAFELLLPDFLASWDVWDYWEKERFLSMQNNLNQGDVLFDIGTEHGWCAALYAEFVGGENMVLFEPTPEFWPNIKAIWEKNHLKGPLATFSGLVGADSGAFSLPPKGEWPSDARGGLMPKLAYRYLHDEKDYKTISRIAIDTFVGLSGIAPDAITIDVEGAELEVLKGARRTLETKRPLVWVSIHPDLAWRDYNTVAGDIISFMHSYGYEGEQLAVDHEEHWIFISTL